jgi:anti-sigma regulatory factor (Ser/Thr protein kinase)
VGSAVRKYVWENENNGDEVRLRVPPVLSVVPELRTLFSSIVTMRGFSKRDAFRVEAIIDELCNNAIEYGHPSGEYPLEVGCRVFQYHVELNVANTRLENQRDPNALEEIRKRIQGNVSLTLNEKRGRGVELVRMLSSEFLIEFPNDKTLVRIIKKKEV